MDNIPYGYCQCGCGNKTRLADRNHSRYGYVKGEPLRYLHRHQNTRYKEYSEEDRGYKTLCWIWRGDLNPKGYGIKYLNRKIHGRGQMPAHRHMWEKLHGPVPDGLELHHQCEVRSCCRDEHCKPLTHAEHMREHLTKLSEADKAQAIHLYATTNLTGKEIGNMFGVRQSHVSALANAAGVRRGRSWQHINTSK